MDKSASSSGTVNYEDGICGASDGVGVDHPPASNLCAKGVASRVNGVGPWTWACSGINGGQASACTAPKKTDGICGAAGSSGVDEMPMNDLCSAGFASAVTGDGPWNWTCSGLYGGVAATCSASPKRAAVCGSASLSGHKDTPHDNLCSVGQATSVHGGGPWNWTCNGLNGGSSVACQGAVSGNGICGASNGVAVSGPPSEGLCMHGNATRVTGSGPWSWNCSGTDGGDTESCTAPLISRQQQDAALAASTPQAAPLAEAAGNAPVASIDPQQAALCGSATEILALEAPSKDLCKNAKASDVSGNGPWTWSCADDAGHTASCSTLAPAANFSDAMPAPHAAPQAPVPQAQPDISMSSEDKAICGFSSGQGAAQAPSDGLCNSGKATPVRGTGPWRWTCVKDRSKASCEAPKLIEAACGISNGSVQKFAPTKGLCSSGTPTDIQGTGPWLWTCVGQGGGASISCSATSQAQTKVDASCGAAAASAATGTPTVNLCDSGIASNVYGEGPWTWTCSGLNGGIATSCSAQKTVPSAPPPPGPAANGLCGAANGVAMAVQPMDELCSAGTVTAVSGNGPWNWNCLGSNGGMTVSCTAPLQPPSPITGVCGSSNGVPTLTTPRSGLCSAGISSSVNGKGPWTWSCSGTNGGGAVGCVAPLAGTNVGSLPSLVSTPGSNEAPTPMASPSRPVTSSGLVTPRLPTGPLPPLQNGNLPSMNNSKSFLEPPQPSPVPPQLSPSDGDNTIAPSEVPDLPEGAKPLQPPAIRDKITPSSALTPPPVNGAPPEIPGNHMVLSDDISTVAFIKGSENISADIVPNLDKLVSVLEANPTARITLTAYASNGAAMSPREARRLSLTRALAVRDYLTSKGVSSGRIDVRALGANAPSGEPDRVDIKAN